MGGLRRLKRKSANKYAVEPLRRDPGHQSEKLSAVILDFARPLIDNVDDSQFETAITLAITFWNLALFPEEQQERKRRATVRKLSKGKPAWFTGETEGWSRMLLDRKKALFGQDRRMVVSHQITDDGGDFHLYVASAVVPL